jgi:hypothetical protein
VTATHGFPAADASVGTVVDAVEEVGRVVGGVAAVFVPPPPLFSANAATRAITRTPTPIAASSRRRFCLRRAVSIAAARARELTHCFF